MCENKFEDSPIFHVVMSYFLGVNQAHTVHREVAFHSSKDGHKVSDGYCNKGARDKSAINSC